MRELKFRAWANYGEMLHNVQNHIGNDSWAFGNMIKSDDFVVMQFTGLKDKNGVDIYGGDIVQDEEHYYSVISWNNDDYMYVASDVGGLADICFPIKVIGNIYENPELLQETK